MMMVSPDIEDDDIDGDGFSNLNDDFPLDDREWLDTDGDGVGNNTDTDDDNDGISDVDEKFWGFNPLDGIDGHDADADNDGVSNKDEIDAGSSPLDADDTKTPTKYAPIMIDDILIIIPYE
ncbi:MAG: hypothetical protein Q9M36_03935 [Sulfurovum sp.]|nr:hypothetical protein [Sulfurovum sp.]